MSFTTVSRRQFAGDAAAGDYAVPSLANPVQVDPALAPYRSDFWGKVGEVGTAFGAYWGGIWDIMTGKDDSEKENFSPEQKQEMSEADGGASNGLFVMFGLAIAAYVFLARKGG